MGPLDVITVLCAVSAGVIVCTILTWRRTLARRAQIIFLAALMLRVSLSELAPLLVFASFGFLHSRAYHARDCRGA